jgi:hypothetical protein
LGSDPELDLEGADVDATADDAGQAALVELGGVGVVAGVEGRAAGQQRVGPGRAAVVLQRAEQGVDVEQVGGVEAAAAGNSGSYGVAYGGGISNWNGTLTAMMVFRALIVPPFLSMPPP